MDKEQEIRELLETISETLYQHCEGACQYCGAQDYPVNGEKSGYDEVKSEDAEEWNIDHTESCIVTKLDKARVLLKPCSTCGGKTWKVATKEDGWKPGMPPLMLCPACQSQEHTEDIRLTKEDRKFTDEVLERCQEPDHIAETGKKVDLYAEIIKLQADLETANAKNKKLREDMQEWVRFYGRLVPKTVIEQALKEQA